MCEDNNVGSFVRNILFIFEILRSGDIQSNTVTENCTGCQLPIHVKNLVFDGESNWHYKCFCCNICGSALVGQKYYVKEEKLFCNNCFLAEYLPTCYSCKVELHGKGYLPSSFLIPSEKLFIQFRWHKDELTLWTSFDMA